MYKKGQIVPNQLIKRKSNVSHLVKFGCDCKIIGRELFALSSGNLIEISKQRINGKKGKPHKYLGVLNFIDIKGNDCDKAFIYIVAPLRKLNFRGFVSIG
jgi:hypothetical protein